MLRNTVLAVPMMLSLASCQRQVSLASPFVPVPASSIVYRDDSGGVRDKLERVVTSDRDWQALWERATSTQPSPPSRPSIDFDREMIVAVGAGPRKAGDRISIDSTGVRDDVYFVFVTVLKARDQFDVDVFPLEIVRLARTDKTVDFIWTDTP